jgi:hypothetical protein
LGSEGENIVIHVSRAAILLQTLTLALLSGDLWARASISFDGTVFEQSWSGAQGNARVIEYLPHGATSKNWERMLSIQCHPVANELKEVTGPYYEQRKSLVATRPSVIKNKQDHKEDASLVLFLGKPGATEHIEFVIARFIARETGGVYAIIYSHKFPAARNVDVSVAVENKERWNQLLAEVSLPDIVASCEVKAGEAE